MRMTSDHAEQARRLGPWFHNLHLPDGTQTAPDHWLGDFPAFKWAGIADAIPANLTGWSVLDIGCNAGFYSFELARRGAEVLGIDCDERYLAQARWAARILALDDRTEFRRMQVYDLARIGRDFDLVLFMGVLYHLRYPMLGLDIVAERTRRMLVLQTLTRPGEAVYPAPAEFGFDNRALLAEPGWPTMSFIEHSFQNDPTNWWAPDHACVQAMIRAAGMRVRAVPAHEVYVCEPDPDRPSAMRTWNRSEFLSATAQVR